MSEQKRAQEFARVVADEMLRIRGWTPDKAPREVVADVFATTGRHEALYSGGFARHSNPKVTAGLIQRTEWDS